MTAPVVTVTVPVPPPERAEIRRYAGCPTGSDDLLERCLNEMQGLTYRVCYTECPVGITENGLDLGFTETASNDLQKALSGCDRALLFAATLGPVPDRLIARYGRLSPAMALFVQAMATERIEALCDAFCRERAAAYAEKGLRLRPRFSPGYGDLPLELQRSVFAVLDCPRHLGLTLSDSLLMLPTKSVTALAGVTDQ